MFLVNSRLGLLSAALSQERPLSRSYRTILPSSLTMNLSSALVFSTRSRVSVYSTDDHYLKLSRFSWQSAYLHYPRNRSIAVLSFHLYRRASLPVSKNTGFNVLFRQYAAVSPLRRCIAVMISTGILTCLPSGSPLGLPLGSDLPPDD